MIDFNNLKNLSPINRKGMKTYVPTDKKEKAQVAVGLPGAVDVVQISNDAAMKGRLSAFASTLAKAMNDVEPERLERLKAEYAGDNCPINAKDLAEAIVSRVRAEGFGDE